MVLINGQNTKVLSDPWVTFDNKSNTNYFNFPENKYTKYKLKKLNLTIFIYLILTQIIMIWILLIYLERKLR